MQTCTRWPGFESHPELWDTEQPHPRSVSRFTHLGTVHYGGADITHVFAAVTTAAPHTAQHGHDRGH